MSLGKGYSMINFRIWIRKKTGYVYLKLWLITTKLSVTVCETLEANWELDVAAAHNILNLEFRKLSVKAKLLNNAHVLARRQAPITFALCTCDDHLARSENEWGCFGHESR
jgi:hypothetical protein